MKKASYCFLVIALALSFTIAANLGALCLAEDEAHSLPERIRDNMIVIAEEQGMPLDAPFAVTLYSEKSYADDNAPDNWLIYEATMAEGAVYFRQVLAGEDVLITVDVAKSFIASADVSDDVFYAFVRMVMQSVDPGMNETAAEGILTGLIDAARSNPNEAHFHTLRDFTYTLSVDGDGELCDIIAPPIKCCNTILARTLKAL